MFWLKQLATFYPLGDLRLETSVGITKRRQIWTPVRSFVFKILFAALWRATGVYLDFEKLRGLVCFVLFLMFVCLLKEICSFRVSVTVKEWSANTTSAQTATFNRFLTMSRIQEVVESLYFDRLRGIVVLNSSLRNAWLGFTSRVYRMTKGLWDWVVGI